MKIALFTDSVGGGGGGRVCGRLSEIWTGLGHDVFLFAESDPSSTDYHFDFVVRETVHQTEITESLMNNLCDRYKFEIAVIIGRVVGRNFDGMLRMLRRRQVKVVSMLHHSFSTWLYFLCIGDECKSKEYLDKIDCLVCVDALQTIWWHEFGARALWIENPISLQIQDDFIKENRRRIVWVGRASDSGKRLDLMIDIFARLLKDVPDARLCILGDVPNNKLIVYKQRYGADLMSRLERPGFVSNVAEYIRKSDVLAFTSLLEVAVPQVVLEAQACGIPVVAMDIPVLRSMNSHSGIIKCQNQAKMVLELKNLLLDDLALQSLKRSALLNAKACATASRSNEKWCELFSNLSKEGDLASLYIEKEYSRIDTIDNVKAVLKEVQRGFSYFEENHFHKLHRESLRCKLSGLVRRIMNKIAIGRTFIQFFDCIRRR